MHKAHAVAGLAGVVAALALAAPGDMCALWPARPNRHVRLMQGWALSTLGLAGCLAGAKPEHATACVCAASVPWDLSWGGRMGRVAAVTNAVCLYVLLN